MDVHKCGGEGREDKYAGIRPGRGGRVNKQLCLGELAGGGSRKQRVGFGSGYFRMMRRFCVSADPARLGRCGGLECEVVGWEFGFGVIRAELGFDGWE